MRASFAQRLCLALLLSGATFALGRLLGQPAWLMPLTVSVSAVWLGALGWQDGGLRAQATAVTDALHASVTAFLAGAGGALCAQAAHTALALVWRPVQGPPELGNGASWAGVGVALLCVSGIGAMLQVRPVTSNVLDE